MGLVDHLLGHARRATEDVWFGAVPGRVLDHWWARGDQDRTYAFLDLDERSAAKRAWYAALDRDPARAREQFRIALATADASSIEMVALATPRTDAELLDLALRASRRFDTYASGSLGRVFHPELTVPEIETLADMPKRLAWAALRLEQARQVPTLEQAWAATYHDDDVRCLLLATRALGAWHVVPDVHRMALVNLLALDGEHATIAKLVAELAPTDATATMAVAAIDTATVPAAWVDRLRAAAARAPESFDEGLLTHDERETAVWAAAICDGHAVTDERAASAIAAAHATAIEWAQKLGGRARGPSRTSLLRRVAKACEPGGRRYSAVAAIAMAGAAGERELVREAIDQLEQTFGPLAELDDFGLAAAVAYYPGRSRAAAALLDNFMSASLRAHVALGLADDGHEEEAGAELARALEEPPSHDSRELVELLSSLVVGRESEARGRLDAFIAARLARLPGPTWVTREADPVETEPVHVARSPELEASLAADPASALVYGDWLLTQGDPRGELIALQHAGKLAEAEALLARHRDHFIGALTRCGAGASLRWRHGFIEAARLVQHERVTPPGSPSAAAALASLLEHPSGALLRELVIALDIYDGLSDFAPAIAELARQPRPTLRHLRIGDFHHVGGRSTNSLDVDYDISFPRFGDLRGLWPQLPHLEALVLQGCFPDPQLGAIDIPSLRELTIVSGGLAGDNTRSLASVQRPQLEVLELWFGSSDYGFSGDVEDVLPLLDGARLPRVHTLRLMNAELADALVPHLVRSPLLPQLREVSLALGTLSDDGAAIFAEHADAFAHLEILDLEANCLTDEGIELVAELAGDVRLDDQKDPEAERYVSVAE